MIYANVPCVIKGVMMFPFFLVCGIVGLITCAFRISPTYSCHSSGFLFSHSPSRTAHCASHRTPHHTSLLRQKCYAPASPPPPCHAPPYPCHAPPQRTRVLISTCLRYRPSLFLRLRQTRSSTTPHSTSPTRRGTTASCGSRSSSSSSSGYPSYGRTCDACSQTPGHRRSTGVS